jgi:hypothetical protein
MPISTPVLSYFFMSLSCLLYTCNDREVWILHLYRTDGACLATVYQHATKTVRSQMHCVIILITVNLRHNVNATIRVL